MMIGPLQALDNAKDARITDLQTRAYLHTTIHHRLRKSAVSNPMLKLFVKENNKQKNRGLSKRHTNVQTPNTLYINQPEVRAGPEAMINIFFQFSFSVPLEETRLPKTAVSSLFVPR